MDYQRVLAVRMPIVQRRMINVCPIVLIASLVPLVAYLHLTTTRPLRFLQNQLYHDFGFRNRNYANSALPSPVSSHSGNATPVGMATTSLCRPPKRQGVGMHPENIMSIKPFKYLSNFKNPCFKRPGTKTISCFPYYFLIGAPKSGTTDLSKRISRHPQVCSSVTKEPHWLTRKRYYRGTVGAHKFYPTIAKGYSSIFDKATRAIVASGNESLRTKVVGDCSASTLWDNTYWPILKENENRSEPIHTNADFIHHLNPRAKIIAILRNPIDRLYSEYLYFNEQNKSAEQFHAGVEKALAYFSDCFQRCSYRNCIYTQARQMRVHIGLYFYSVADFMKVFPKNQILVIKMEDYSLNMTQYMRQVFSFLKLDQLDDERMAFVTSTRTIFNSRNNTKIDVGPMLAATRQILHRFYKPHNEKLEKLLGTKLWEDETAE